MAIGHGRGEEKVFHAIQQALNHPLLESVSLEDASGVIANFSGGDDLSLYEVGEAIGHIRSLTGDNIDVVMGVSHDERMHDRAQVILVVTGLGAKSLADVVPGAEKVKVVAGTAPKAAQELVNTELASMQIAESEPAMPVDILNDLDVPAFMRKKARFNVRVPERN
jgi:cell division protein FtsZ